MTTWKNATRALASSVALVLTAGTALATDFCYDKACSNPGDACHAGVCVPKDKLCKSDAGCKGWQRCDFSCPGGVMGSGTATPGSTGSGGGGTACASSDGDACSAQDGGSAGGAPKAPSPDGGSSDQAFQQDAASADVGAPPPCPKDEGICVVDVKKLVIQPGCADFCTSALKCDLLGGNGGTGGNQTDPGEPPAPKDSDASAGAPAYPDAGSTPVPAQDAGAADRAKPDASGVQPPPDAGSGGGGGGPDQQAQCELFCSVWKLENVAQAEFASLAQCVASKKDDCAGMNSACESLGETFGKAAEQDMTWSLGLGIGFGETTSQAGGTGSDKNADAGATYGCDSCSGDGSNSPRAPDAGGAKADSVGASSGSSGTSSSSSGCTAGASSNASPWVLGLLAVFGLGAIVRRRVRA